MNDYITAEQLFTSCHDQRLHRIRLQRRHEHGPLCHLHNGESDVIKSHTAAAALCLHYPMSLTRRVHIH